MKATEINFLKFLQQPNQFVIPIYQRTYSWTIKQCQQLWNDIIGAALDDTISGHFVGSIVYIEGGLYQVASVPQLLVIDGQQRLTTLSLILTALVKVVEELDEKLEPSPKKIENYFIFNNQEDGEARYKLLLTQGDRETFIRLIERRDLPQNASKRIVENYQYFEDQIRKQEISPSSLYRGINKLLIVNIALERDRDNPQLIFESLNSTGLDLSQADLIRNYVLMRLPPKEQEKVYNHYWYPMEQSFERGDQPGLFDRFMRDYLTLKSRSGAIPNIRDVYSSFKVYVQKQKEFTIENIVQDIYHYSKHYVKLALEQENDPTIKQALSDINTLKVDVAYPFLLEVYEDYHQKILTKDDFISILRLVESYVFRRAICGIPTNSMNKTFATFGREIAKSNYLPSIESAFLTKEAYKRFPNDEEFRREFIVKDIYNFRNRNYVLRKLENYDRTKELVNPENYTIEHIMPQTPNLSERWQADLGDSWQDIQAKYLHTIGNLTLTGYNAEYSDRPFLEKRDIKDGFADSPLRLNRMLAQVECWNETEIQERAKGLTERAIKIWSFPLTAIQTSLQDFISKPDPQNNYEEYLQGYILNLFEALRKRILNLDASVTEEFKKYYIAYKVSTNFVDIYPQKNRLRLILNLNFDELVDPKGLCKDITGWRMNGDVEIGFSSLDQLDDVMNLIRQSFDKHSE